jgi:hypothetical protein
MSTILNVCIGHKAFPTQCAHYFDYMLSPFPISTDDRFFVVSHRVFGENGPSLSEYAQLFWLLENLDQFLRDHTHIRIFQYRRFVSDGQTGLGEPSSLPYAKAIKEDQLQAFHGDFARSGGGEIVNAPYKFAKGILAQYADSHALGDFLDFAKFLDRQTILTTFQITDFIRGEVLIPGSSIGVLTVENFKMIYALLFKASAFMNDASFTARTGYQRRNMGFLLERLHSYLLLKGIREGKITKRTGEHIVISEGLRIGSSGDIFEGR